MLHGGMSCDNLLHMDVESLEFVDTAHELVAEMDMWLTGPDADPPLSELIDWCRSARDLLQEVARGDD